MFQTKVVQKITTHILCSIHFFPENRAVYEIMWEKNMVEPDRSQMIIWRMRIACWIANATNTHSDYVILSAFAQPMWLHEGASVLRYTTVRVLLIFNQSVKLEIIHFSFMSC